ncbi:MAG: hypothetical protein WCG99_02025 [Candidatus Berkelbacteria bacterium]
MSNFWKIFISIIVTIAVAGGGIYYLMQKQIDSIRSDNQAQMDALNKQIAALKSTASATATTSPVVTTDEAASWKTWTNDSVGFSIKYPSNYSAGKASSYSDNDGVFINVLSGDQGSLVSVEAEQSSLSLDSYIAGAVADKTFSSATKITFAGLPAYEGADNGIITSYGILVKSGSNIFHVVADTGNLDGLAKNKAALTTIQNQILASFQFTK